MNDMTLPEVERLRRDNECLRIDRITAEHSREVYRREREAIGRAMDDVLTALLANDHAEAKRLAEAAVTKWVYTP